jgi:hypothetical protein
MIVPTMRDYGLKPPPNSIIHLLPILDQNHLQDQNFNLVVFSV